ncbi:hypothetical protein AB5I41_24990 [Sphingomonas sp. MMS24-JH45]
MLQYVGSMHVYDRHLGRIDKYLDEGFQQTAEMPPMPQGDPFKFVGTLIDVERLRRGEAINAGDEQPYWADLIRLIQVFWAGVGGRPSRSPDRAARRAGNRLLPTVRRRAHAPAGARWWRIHPDDREKVTG